MPRFPTVIASSVIRSAHQGQSHGGVYVVDLENERCAQVIDWDDDTISWEGRGLDRGLRGIALYGDNICIAASDEIFVYNKSFEIVGSHRNRYLRHCHETFLDGDSLYLTSTGFDSILEFDLLSKSFAKGYCLRGRELSLFDPNSRSGPEPADTLHINNVHCLNGDLYTTGTGLTELLVINNGELSSYATIPPETHNAQPFRDGVLINDTAADRISLLDRTGEIVEAFDIIRYDEGSLLMTDLPEDHARQAFGRGLCMTDDGLIIGGSSPATISVYEFGRPEPLKTVNITMDVRNSIHGLEIWPYDPL